MTSRRRFLSALGLLLASFAVLNAALQEKEKPRPPELIRQRHDRPGAARGQDAAAARVGKALTSRRV